MARDSRQGTESSHWYVAQVQPRKEELAATHLERQSFRVFLPYVKRKKARSGRVKEHKEPFFPGYIFVELDLERQPWRSINGTIGVSRIVMFGDYPAIVALDFVEQLLANSDSEGVIRFDDPLSVGRRVRVVGGPFDEHFGSILSSDRHSRVTVLMNLLSGAAQVTLPKANLMAC